MVKLEFKEALGEVIVLKNVILDIRSGRMDPESQKLRHQALVMYNYIERCENFVVNSGERVYNNITMGDMALIEGVSNE